MSSHLSLFFLSLNDLPCSYLESSSIRFINFPVTSCLEPLSLHKHGFLSLLKPFLVITEHKVFMSLDNFDLSVFKCFAHKDLQNWLNCQIEVKETFLDIIKLDSFIISFLIWDVNSRWWLIYKIVAGYRVFIHHVILIIQWLPVMVSGRRLTILLWAWLLCVKTSFVGLLLCLFHYLLLQSLLFQSCKTVSVCHLFGSSFLGRNGIRLHVYRVTMGVTQSIISFLDSINLLTGITNAANVFPRTTLLSYMIFCGATFLQEQRRRREQNFLEKASQSVLDAG